MSEYSILLPQETIDSLRVETSVIHSTEAARVRAVANLTYQTINSVYGDFIPRETHEANYNLADRIIVVDDLLAFGKAWDMDFGEPVRLEGLTGNSFRRGGIITILNPEAEWGKCCPHCKAQDIEMLGSEPKARELYKGRYYTTFVAHEEVHQFQDWTLPGEFQEAGAYFYTSVIARRLGHNPIGDELAGMRYDAYEALLSKYGNDVHKIFFGSVDTLNTRLRKPTILREILKQKDTLFPNGQDL